MFYTNIDYKETMNKFISKNGSIIKLIDPKTGKIIGNLIRHELNNDIDEASILINISLFDENENFKKYSFKNLKYFGIKHSLKKETNVKTKIKYFKINENNFDKEIINFLKNYKLSNEEVNLFIIEKIKKIKSYYKNKNIIAYCI